MLAFDLGSHEVDARVHHRAGAAPAHSHDAGRRPGHAGEGDSVGEGAVRVAAWRAGAQLLRGGPGWLLAPPVAARARGRERGGGFLEHRSQPAGAPGEDGSSGREASYWRCSCGGRRRTEGLERGARALAGGRSAPTADARDRHGARGSEMRAQSDPGVARDARHPAGPGRDVPGAAGDGADRRRPPAADGVPSAARARVGPPGSH